MLRGLYTAASGMITQQRRHDTITNNIANMNTPGFKQVNEVSRAFPEMLIAMMKGGVGSEAVSIGRFNSGVLAEENVPTFVQGDVQETNNTFDFALVQIEDPNSPFDASGKFVTPDGQVVFQPQAMFTVQDLNGDVRYTRNGKFMVNAAGQLVTGEGYRVLGQDGQPLVLTDPLTLQPISNVKVNAQGQLLGMNDQPLVNAAGQPVAMLVSRIDQPHALVREGDGVFRLDTTTGATAVPVVPADLVEVRQGFIERSNVDPAQSMIDMNAALRAYEANQKVIQFYDKSMEKAVNEVGRV